MIVGCRKWPLPRHRFAPGEQPPFRLSGLDVSLNRLLRARADHRPHVVRRIVRLAHRDLRRARFELFEEAVVNGFMHDRARARRALLPLIPERRHRDAFHRGIQIAFAVHDDRVLAAHLGHHALDPDLAFLRFGGEFVDVQSDIARSGERNEARLRMRHQQIADRPAASRQEAERRRREIRLRAAFRQIRPRSSASRSKA